MPVSRTNVPSVLSVLLPSTKVSWLAWGSSCLTFPLSTSSVLDRSSSSSFPFACHSVAAFVLVGLSFCFSESALMSSVAVLACSTLFALGLDFFVRGPQLDYCHRNVLQGS